ncbi:MAG: hypothetical protein Pg6C_02500 [Treponemataceae bacterium]|nr:MAG: hypothetical protein Pg6C_02500 [Treponemataceae bacterium]
MEYLILLAKYNKEANAKMNVIIGTLADDEWNKQFNAHFKSIHELCAHVYNSDFTWLTRLKSAGDFKTLRDEYFSGQTGANKLLIGNIDEYMKKRADLDARIVNFMAELTDSDTAKKIKFVNYKGVEFEKTAGVLLTHMFNHDTHHRAMVSVYLEMLGKENDYSGLYPYG